LPANFDSPLKASSIIDFWSRWHMTLTRLLTAYLYNPLTLALTRRRLARGAPAFNPRSATLGTFLSLLALPTLLTMFVSGLWHGAGYLFVAWGLLHGAYLVINHAWRLFAPRRWPAADRLLTPRVSHLLTLLAVVVSMVLFRSPTLAVAQEVLAGMAGLNGIGLPATVHEVLAGLVGGLPSFMWAIENQAAVDFVQAIAWLVGLLLIALGLPNTLELLARFEPALHMKRPGSAWPFRKPIEWRPSLPWAAAIAIVAVAGILGVQGKSEFLYWQF
jgi:D-alanyl-lipoteichoic acid acyltransferase DltB (MBOAT superfamily)